MEYVPVNLQDKFDRFSEHWSPRVIAQMNHYQFMLIKIQGEFVWHSHPGTDEVFIVFDGTMEIQFPDGKVTLSAGEMFVVPRGIEHRPYAASECMVMLVEPAGTVNTGDSGGDLIVENDVWI